MNKTLGQIAHEAGERHEGWARCWGNCSDGQKASWEAIAQDVAQAAAVPEGWKLVPVEPTPEMLADTFGLGEKEARRMYLEWLAAAPKLMAPGVK